VKNAKTPMEGVENSITPMGIRGQNRTAAVYHLGECEATREIVASTPDGKNTELV
jgi:hypothetical protein